MQTLRASDCGLSTALLSPAILDVLDTLTNAGFDAYIVGGGVRDLLLGLRPKDFDAVTNATPAQIRDIFGRRCRIIGRRFELAHVYSGREMIEVATFRAPPKQVVTSASGMVLRDNVWGSIEQDYARRDFSINTLYYQPRQDVILDFCDAYQDILDKKLRLLGKPAQRFEEDPVRMLRVLRFAAKLNFEIDASILDVLTPTMTLLLREVSPHRLYDESQKMFSAGHLDDLLPLLIEYHVWHQLFSDAAEVISPFIQRVAANTDQRIRVGKSINPAFFYAVLLWQPYLDRLAVLTQRGLPHAEARTQAALDVLKRQSNRTAIPRYSEAFIRETWEMQPRLEQPKARQIPTLAAGTRFRAGFDFLYLREQSGDTQTNGMGQWWHDYQELSTDQKEAIIQKFNRQQIKEKRKQSGNQSTAAIPDIELPPLDVPVETERSRKSAPRQRQADTLGSTGQRGNNSSNANTTARHNHSSVSELAMTRRKRRPRDLSQVIMDPLK